MQIPNLSLPPWSLLSCELWDLQLNTWRTQQILIYAKSLECYRSFNAPQHDVCIGYRQSWSKLRTFANTLTILIKFRGTSRLELSTLCIQDIQDTISCIALSSRIGRVSFANERTNRSLWQMGFFSPGPIILHTICTIILFQLCTNGCLIARSRAAGEVPFRKKILRYNLYSFRRSVVSRFC